MQVILPVWDMRSMKDYGAPLTEIPPLTALFQILSDKPRSNQIFG
jgi:hypothetical protein